MTVWPESATAVSEAEFDTVDMTINIGPQHPATHGVFRRGESADSPLLPGFAVLVDSVYDAPQAS